MEIIAKHSGTSAQPIYDALADAVEQIGGDRNRFVALTGCEVGGPSSINELAERMGLDPDELADAYERVFHMFFKITGSLDTED